MDQVELYLMQVRDTIYDTAGVGEIEAQCRLRSLDLGVYFEAYHKMHPQSLDLSRNMLRGPGFRGLFNGLGGVVE